MRMILFSLNGSRSVLSLCFQPHQNILYEIFRRMLTTIHLLKKPVLPRRGWAVLNHARLLFRPLRANYITSKKKYPALHTSISSILLIRTEAAGKERIVEVLKACNKLKQYSALHATDGSSISSILGQSCLPQ